MKIMVISNGWGIKTIGGGEYHILNVMSKWSKNNELYLIIPKSGYEISKKIFKHNYTLFFSSNEIEVDSLKTNLTLYLTRAIRSTFVRSVKQDITIASSHLFYDTLPAYFHSKKSKSKFVVYNHSIIKKTRKTKNGLYNVLSYLNEMIGLYLTKKSDLIFTVDNDTKNYLLNHGYDKNKIISTFNGIENNTISKIYSNKIEYHGCYCGRVSKTKGVYDIITVWKEVIKVIPQANFIIIGNGPEFEPVKELIIKNGLVNHIILKGFVSEDEKIRLIKSSKIFLFPSYEEAWGISVSEALSCGVPPICYNLKAYDIYQNGITKVETGCVKDLSKVTIEILRDEEKRSNLIEKGKKVIDQFKDWNKISEEQLEWFQKITTFKINKNNNPD